MTVLGLLGLQPHAAVVTGSARFGPRQLIGLRGRELREVRGGEIGIVFQDPLTTPAPDLSIGTQLTEHMRRHLGLEKDEAYARAVKLLHECGPGRRARRAGLPAPLLGRDAPAIVIAMALGLRPKLLIADEPTTALDVTVQAGVLQLIRTSARAAAWSAARHPRSRGDVERRRPDLGLLRRARGRVGSAREVLAAPGTRTPSSCCSPCPTRRAATYR